jgi:hypothetical protein
MALCRIVLQQDDILCELYADTRYYSDNESMDGDIDIARTSSRKQLRSSTGPKTPQFPPHFS